MPCFKNISFKRLKVPASYLTLGSGCGRIFPEKSQKAVKETSGAFNAPESRRQVKAGAETADRIPPEPRAQQGFPAKPPVSAAGTPPLPGRVLLDMPEWVV